MPITRIQPPLTLAYAEINDEGTVDVGIRLSSGLVSRDLTPEEALQLADEIRETAAEAIALQADVDAEAQR